jgi:peptide/nickel transport system permease protein
MLRYLLRRLPSLLGVLLVASLLIFSMLRLIPGDPATTLAGSNATPQTVAAIRHQLGLDRPLPEQYFHWLGDVLTFHLGRSYILGGSINDLIWRGLANTLALAASALLIAVVIAMLLGPLWGASERGWLDGLLTAGNTLAVAVPPFVTGVLALLVVGVELGWLPVGGSPPGGLLADPGITVQYLILPAVCLGLPLAAVLTRFLAERVRTELAEPYVVTALAAGVPRRRVVRRHALRNALPTTVTVLGLQVGSLLGGAILVEVVFAWPGLGQLMQQAISRRDYPVVQILLLFSVATFAVIQVVTDLVCAALDPRIRIEPEL